MQYQTFDKVVNPKLPKFSSTLERLDFSQNINLDMDKVPETPADFEEVTNLLLCEMQVVRHHYTTLCYFKELCGIPADERRPHQVEFLENYKRWIMNFKPWERTDRLKQHAGLCLFTFDGAWKTEATAALDHLNSRPASPTEGGYRVVNPIPVRRVPPNAFKRQRLSHPYRSSHPSHPPSQRVSPIALPRTGQQQEAAGASSTNNGIALKTTPERAPRHAVRRAELPVRRIEW